MNHVVIYGEGSSELGYARVQADGWTWGCCACGSRSARGHLSASAAVADFESHVEVRHP